MSAGDSGGAVFIQQGETWKLAGINLAVDGPYNTSTNGPGFSAALFDARGFYVGEEGNWSFIFPADAPEPGAFYATRISTSLVWINQILMQQFTDDNQPVLQSALNISGPFEDELEATVQPEMKTIRILRPIETRFYRLRSCVSVRLVGIRLEGENLVLKFALE